MSREAPGRFAALATVAGIGVCGLITGMGGAAWLRHAVGTPGGARTGAATPLPRPPAVGYAQGGAFDVRAHSSQIPGVISGGQITPPGGPSVREPVIVIAVDGTDHVFHSTSANVTWLSTPSAPDSRAIISWAGLPNGVCGYFDATQNGMTAHEHQCQASGSFGFTGHWSGGAAVQYGLRVSAQ